MQVPDLRPTDPSTPTDPTPMRIAKYLRGPDPSPRLGLVDGDQIRPIGPPDARLSDLLHAEDPVATIREWLGRADPNEQVPLGSVRLLSPMDRQEVWGAGVTYE